MGIFSQHKPMVLKADTSATLQLEQLRALQGSLTPAGEKLLKDDIRALETGIKGEERILFELENSHLPLIVIRDLHLQHEGLAAQIDFLVLTQQRDYVLECKNLYGDIEINAKGEFLRSFNGKRKEGIYSPVTQNQRHLDLMRQMIVDDSGNAVAGALRGKASEDLRRGLVVLANPKTVLNDKAAPAEIKKQVIRHDQLISTIQSINSERGLGRGKTNWEDVESAAARWLSRHNPIQTDYTAKYQDMLASPLPASAQQVICPVCGSPMVLRTAKRGERKGKQFYGCSNFPKCRGIVNVE